MYFKVVVTLYVNYISVDLILKQTPQTNPELGHWVQTLNTGKQNTKVKHQQNMEKVAAGQSVKELVRQSCCEPLNSPLQRVLHREVCHEQLFWHWFGCEDISGLQQQA